MSGEITFNSANDPRYVDQLNEIDRSAALRDLAVAVVTLAIIGGGIAMIAIYINELEMAAIGLGTTVVGGGLGLYGCDRVVEWRNEKRKELFAKIVVESVPTTPRTPPASQQQSQPKPIQKAAQGAPVITALKQLTVKDLPEDFASLQDRTVIEALARNNKRELLEFINANESYKNLIVAEMVAPHLNQEAFDQFLKDNCYQITQYKVEKLTAVQVGLLYKMKTVVPQHHFTTYVQPFAASHQIDLSLILVKNAKIMEELEKIPDIKQICHLAIVIVESIEETRVTLTAIQKTWLKAMIDLRMPNACRSEKATFATFSNRYLRDV